MIIVVMSIMSIVLIVLGVTALWFRATAYSNKKAAVKTHRDNEDLRQRIQSLETRMAEAEHEYKEERRAMGRVIGRDYRQMKEDLNCITHLKGENIILRWRVLVLKAGMPKAIESSKD